MALFHGSEKKTLLSAAFNQDQGCFAVGMDNGFRIYNCEPFKETFRRGNRDIILGIDIRYLSTIQTKQKMYNAYIFNFQFLFKYFADDFKGGVGIVEMLFRCNLLALVGGGHNPKFPPTVVKIWDDHQNRAIGDLNFRSEVKAVKLRRDRVVVVLQHKIYVYRFSDLKLLDQISTLKNPRGLIALCPDSSSVVSHTSHACFHTTSKLLDTSL